MKFIPRAIYTIKQARIFKKSMASGLWEAKTVLHIDPLELKNKGIKVLVLDYDGVLAPHGAGAPLPEVIAWLENTIKIFSPLNVFILSNNPSKSREDYFAEKFDGVHFVVGTRKKPYPDGLHKILEITKVKPNEMVLVDDRILTGVLAAHVVGVQEIYITKPFCDFWHSLFFEWIFKVLRFLEKRWIKWRRHER